MSKPLIQLSQIFGSDNKKATFLVSGSPTDIMSTHSAYWDRHALAELVQKFCADNAHWTRHFNIASLPMQA